MRYARRGRGIGLALYYHGGGFTGSGETTLASQASLELTERGARVLVAQTEMGQGTKTVLPQMAAEALGWPVARIEMAEPDTAHVPNSGPTVASRTCMIVGGLVARCARELKRRLGRLTPREYLRRHGPLVITERYAPPVDQEWDDERYRGGRRRGGEWPAQRTASLTPVPVRHADAWRDSLGP